MRWSRGMVPIRRVASATRVVAPMRRAITTQPLAARAACGLPRAAGLSRLPSWTLTPTSFLLKGARGSAHSARRFATEAEGAALSSMEKFKLNLPTYGAIAGGVLIVYGVSKTVLYITHTFMSVNFSTVAYISFIAGFGAAAFCGALFASGYRMVTIRPEPVFRAALSAVKANPEARQLLGSSIRAGQLRAYVLRTGTFGLDSETRKLTWLRPRVQMLFQVVGSEREGMACVEGTRKLGSLRKVHVNMLTLDVLRSDGDSTMVLVTGSPERLKVRGQLRGFLQTERVKYISQDVRDKFAEAVTPEDM